MILDFLFKKKQQQPAQQNAAPAAAQEETKPKQKESIEERIDREMKSLPGFIKNKVSSPGVKERFVEMAKRMEKDGVDMNNPRAMKKWVKEHEKELKEEQQTGGKVETVVKTGPEVGRNDACPCGSGKKYKKCCGK